METPLKTDEFENGTFSFSCGTKNSLEKELFESYVVTIII